MPNMKPYILMCSTMNVAQIICANKNKACRDADNHRDIYAVVDGPANDWAVVDLSTAIDLGSSYRICR